MNTCPNFISSILILLLMLFGTHSSLFIAERVHDINFNLNSNVAK